MKNRGKPFLSPAQGMLGLIFLSAAVLLGGMVFPAVAEDAAPAAEMTISDIRIDIRQAPPGNTDWVAMARSSIFMQKGDPFSHQLLDQAIEALKNTNRFQKIHVDAEEDDRQMAVIFQLTPFRLVRDVRVRGQYPLFEQKVLNAMTIFPGDNFVQEAVPGQKTAIERLFARHGYIDPQVELNAREDPRDGNFVIHVRIDKGPFYRLGELDISGNRSFSDKRLRMRMSSWRWARLPGSGGRFVEKDLKDDVKDLVAFYRKRGYPEVAVESETKKNTDTGVVSVRIVVNEGPRYDIEFVGNDHFRDRTLKRELVFSSAGNRNNRGVRKSLRKLKDRYRQAGFNSVSVDMEEDSPADAGGDVRRLRFVIDEGPRSIVESIDISGNRAVAAGKIERQILTREPGIFNRGVFRPNVLEEDKKAVLTLYRQKGFMDAEARVDAVAGRDPQRMAVTVAIEENQQTLVGEVTFEGLVETTESEARKKIVLKPGRPFQQRLLHDDEKSLSAVFSEKGFPFVSVTGKATFSPDRTEASIVYRVDPGPTIRLGDIYVTGNLRTKEQVIRNELDITTGERFSPKRVLTAQRDVRNMGVFRSVGMKTIGLKEKREEVALFVEVEERRPYYLEFGAGYESDRGLFGEAGVGDINFLGRNLNIWFNGQLSQIGYRVDTGIAEPRLFGSRYSLAFQAYAERKEEFNKSFGTKQYGAALTFKREWFEKLTASLRFEFEERDQFPTDVNRGNIIKDEEDEFRSRTLVVATPGIVYDTRDSFIRPKKGLFAAGSINFSKGLRDDLDSFFRYRGDLRVFRTPWPRVTFAALARAGYIDPYGDQLQVPDDQLFFLGGIQNVRGYDENLLAYDAMGDALGGRTSAVLSLESRIDLGRNFELTLFYDNGLVADTYSPEYDESFRSSVGVGLRYITPIGPMGVIYGHKIDPREGESDGRWHVSIGYTF